VIRVGKGKFLIANKEAKCNCEKS